MSEQDRPEGGHAQDTELKDSNPNAAGPDGAAGEMGISSERVGHTGPRQKSTDGTKDTTAPLNLDDGGDNVGSDGEFAQGPEDNPEGLEPKAGYPSKDPRSD